MPGSTANYNYDPFGRQESVTSNGQIVERSVYDGFDHVVESQKMDSTGAMKSTTYTFDPLDRTASKTANDKTTDFEYLGLSSEVLDEKVAGTLTKSYQYSPWGERLSQVKYNSDGTTEDGYYSYNGHTDVETVTDNNGDAKATYGYTAYGSDDTSEFTGIDKPDPADPTKEDYNPYRYNAKRWDAQSGTYDMGFRDYNPGLNRFTTRDMYTGALADMGLGADPYTGNRYAFTGGNPVSRVEFDGHDWCLGVCDAVVGFVSDHSDQIRDAAITAGGLALTALGASEEGLGIVLDATGVGAVIGVPLNVLGAATMTAGVGIALAGGAALSMDTANHSGSSGGSSSSGSSGGNVERAKGSQEGAEQLQERAKELQDERSWGGGTTSVVKVQNQETGDFETWISTEGKTMPKEWDGLLRPEEGERFIPGKGHAEQTIIDNLGDEWKIVEGGTSRNVCIEHATGAGHVRWSGVSTATR